jgi:hypothetical protein
MGGTEETGFEPEETPLDLGCLSLPAGGAEGAPGPTRWKPRASVEAWQLTEANAVALAEWVTESGAFCDQYAEPAQLVIRQAGRPDAKADMDDWIVKGWRGVFWVVLADDFAETYEPASPAAHQLVSHAQLAGALARLDITARADADAVAMAILGALDG